MTVETMTVPDNAIKVLDKGHVYLEQHMGSDLSVANAARVSFAKKREVMDESDEGLVRFLCRNRHGTPFEHNSMTFVVKAPIFVFREWHRHRIASINEMSARYTPMPREWYVPDRDQIRVQKGKPGDYYFERLDDDQEAQNWVRQIEMAQASSYVQYEMMVNAGVAKEVARTVLPVGMYSEMYWTVNLRALMNFLSLRNHKHAQYEIRKYAEAIEEIVTEIFPVAMGAFIENGRQAP